MSSEKVVSLMEYQVGPEVDLGYNRFMPEFSLILVFCLLVGWFNFEKLKFTLL